MDVTAPSLNQRGRATAPDSRVTTKSRQRHTNDVQLGRAVGGGIPTVGADVKGICSVRALGTSANNGDWTGRIMRKNRGVNRRMSVRFVDPATLN